MLGWQAISQQNYDLFIDISLVLSMTLAISLLLRVLQRRLLTLFVATSNRWDDVILDAVSRPVQWIVWVIGLTTTLDLSRVYFITDPEPLSAAADAISIARQLALVVLVAWMSWRLINRVEAHKLDGGSDPTTVQLTGKVAKLAVVVLIVLPVFQLLGISISGILAFGGMGGLIVGLAAKDLLANFFGSLVIYLDRPFKVGDWVRSSDREIEGVVEHIGFRITQIRTFDKRPLYVPNAVFTNITVENPSRMSNRRIYETIGVRYSDARQIPAITAAVRQMLKEHPAIDQQQTQIVNFNSFAASSLDFFIYCFTKTTKWKEFHEIKEDVLLKVMDIIHQHDADCAFPTQTIMIESDHH